MTKSNKMERHPPFQSGQGSLRPVSCPDAGGVNASAPRAERAVTFKAWRNNRRETGNARLDQAITIEEAVAAVTPHDMHRPAEMVASILREDAGRGVKTLFIYGFKRSTRQFHHRNALDGGRPVRVGNIEPVLRHALDVHAFTPVEPFDAFRDDPVDVDRSLVEQK